MYEMLIRKKALKIQERLGMRIGISGGISKIPSPKNATEVLDVLRELYKIGLKAYVLPISFFNNIKSTSDIYKVQYGNLLKIKDMAQKFNIELALHCTNFPGKPDELDSFLKTFFNIASIMDSRMLILRPTFYNMMPQDQAVKLVVHKVNEIVTALRLKGMIGLETTGKNDEVGSLEDIIDITKRTQSTEPVINWGLLHARGYGSLGSQTDYRKVLDKVRASIGQQWLRNAYFLFSGVSYGGSGFIKHIPMKKSDMRLEYFIKEVMSLGIKGTLVFEDPEKEDFILDVLDDLGDMVR